jgi:hypothetical protein
MSLNKYVKKAYKKGTRYAKKRYFKGKGYSNPKIQTMARDVMRLKSMINAEKQNATSLVTTEYPLAQFNGVSSSGLQEINLMPTISQGISEDQRKGDSLKICSWALKIHAYTNGGDTFNGCNYRFYVLREPNNPNSLGNLADNFLETNQFSGVIDYHSNRDYQHFKDYIVMGTVSGKFKAPENTTLSGNKANTHTLARKQEFHIRYDKGTTNIINNPIRLLAVASDGDRSGNNKIFFKYSFKVYYYDN